MDDEQRIHEIPFAKMGAKNQHSNTLFKIGRRDFDLENLRSPTQSYAAETMQDMNEQCSSLLRQNGIELGYNLYVLDAENVVPFEEGKHRSIDAMPLHFAIEERDKATGQKDDFLAALVLHYIARAAHARRQTDLLGPNSSRYDVELDNSMLAQHWFFCLVQRRNIQEQYSIGRVRMDGLNQEESPQAKYRAEAKNLFQHYANEKNHSKERSYQLVADELKRRHPEATDTPGKHTVEFWEKRKWRAENKVG